MNYRLIAIDIDGTLLNPQGTISPRNYAALETAIAQGATVALCTGRGYFMAQKVVGQLELEFPLVLHNGAEIVHSFDGKMITRWALSQETARQGVLLMKQFSLEPIIYDFHNDEHRLVYESIDATNEAYVRYMSTKEPILHQTPDLMTYLDHNPTQLVAINREPIIKEAMLALQESLPDANVFTSGRLYNIEYWFLEMLDVDASKAKAVEYLSQLHQIERAEILAIGDNFNDIDMIEYSAFGVAMDNAPDEVKARADWVTDSCVEDGVAQVIERFVLNYEGKGARWQEGKGAKG